MDYEKELKSLFFRLLSSFSIQNIPIFFKTIKVINKMMMIIANGFPKLIVNPSPRDFGTKMFESSGLK